ncbi:hypothetical protein BDA96_07G225200 [Sorghum bicolor]|uniref:Uncharacterized protein n=1 Tax=Sorghum bicolor TaxID=4558 RepID=A0A921QM70_SORBI|nr:hypothetical protein BDA96_07G225200 [Sorghum bicolor]
MLATMLVYYTTVLLALGLFACHLGLGSWQLHAAVSEEAVSVCMGNWANDVQHCYLSRGSYSSPSCMPCHLASCICICWFCCMKERDCEKMLYRKTQKKVDECSCK